VSKVAGISATATSAVSGFRNGTTPRPNTDERAASGNLYTVRILRGEKFVVTVTVRQLAESEFIRTKSFFAVSFELALT
jgi:hypothetical protein